MEGFVHPYLAESVDSSLAVTALTLDGKLSNDMAATHIDLTDNYMEIIRKMIDNYVKTGGK